MTNKTPQWLHKIKKDGQLPQELPLKDILTWNAFLWLLAGGLFYSIGVFFFSLDRRILSIDFYFMISIIHYRPGYSVKT